MVAVAHALRTIPGRFCFNIYLTFAWGEDVCCSSYKES